MLYREWFSLRLKLGFWVAIYFGAALLYLVEKVWIHYTVNNYQLNGQNIYDTLFGGWIRLISQLTPAMALLGSIDLISEENGRGTLSYLLTRPFTRQRIFGTKILLSTAGLLTVCGLSSLLMLLVDQLPRQVWVSRWGSLPCPGSTLCWGWVTGDKLEASVPVDTMGGLVSLGTVLAVGALIICSTGLLSIFTKNLLQTTVAASPVVLIMYLVLGVTGPLPTNQYSLLDNVLINMSNFGQHIMWMVGLVLATVIVFLAGLTVFNRKEF